VLTRGCAYGRAATSRLVELEERVDPVHGGHVGAEVRLGEGLEPREVARVRGRGRGEGLRVGRGEGGVLVAGLREELGVLLEDLEILLFFLLGLGGASLRGISRKIDSP
jgi:hypothetical protein